MKITNKKISGIRAKALQLPLNEKKPSTELQNNNRKINEIFYNTNK
jgi:hypothetical protein